MSQTPRRRAVPTPAEDLTDRRPLRWQLHGPLHAGLRDQIAAALDVTFTDENTPRPQLGFTPDTRVVITPALDADGPHHLTVHFLAQIEGIPATKASWVSSFVTDTLTDLRVAATGPERVTRN